MESIFNIVLIVIGALLFIGLIVLSYLRYSLAREIEKLKMDMKILELKIRINKLEMSINNCILNYKK